MYFWWDCSVENYLFPGYNLNSLVAFIFTCLSVGILAFILEWFKLLQAKLQQNELILRSRQLRTVCPTESSTLINEENARPEITLKLRYKTITFCTNFNFQPYRIMLSLGDIILWLFNLNTTYFVMLIVMLYNGWFMISILIGSAIGYFIFGHSFAKINIQNYKIIRQSYCMYSCPEAGNFKYVCVKSILYQSFSFITSPKTKIINSLNS